MMQNNKVDLNSLEDEGRRLSDMKFHPKSASRWSVGQGQRQVLSRLPHQNSSQLQECLDPIRGVRDALRRQGIKPVNHARNNLAAVRAQSDKSRAQKAQEQEAAQAAQVPRPSSAASVRSSGYASPHYTPHRPSIGRRQSDVRSESGRSACSSSQAPRPFTPVVRARASGDDGSAWLKKDDYGCIPQYLIERQLQLAASYAQEQAEKEASMIPVGMRVLPEEERLEMLSLLEASKDDTEAKIRALPFIIETPSQRKFRDGLEAKLLEVEEALELFNQPQVLVAI
ncbi:g11067 [Coccomyxa elongata]